MHLLEQCKVMSLFPFLHNLIRFLFGYSELPNLEQNQFGCFFIKEV